VTESKAILPDEPLVILSPVLAKAFGHCGALLIQQIHYWVSARPKFPEEGGGFGWRYDTYEAWAEQVAYSPREVRRTLKKLEKLKVITAGVFNHHKYDRTRWYRIDYVALCLALEVLLGGIWQVRTHKSGPKGHLHVARMSAPIPETPTETHSESKTCELTLATPQAEDSQTKPAGEEEKKYGEAEKLLKTSTKPAFALEEYWYSRMAVISGGKDHKLFTQKERGQLKMLANALGADVRDVIDFAINRWQKFGQKARLVAGLPQYPTVANVGFLLKYHDVAREMLAQSIAPEETAAPVVKPATPVVSPPVVAMAKPKEEHAKFSDEELAAWFEEWEAKK
jgi:hypothetical protein